MKLSSTRRALLLANIFNLLVAIYFIIIAIVGLAQLRWYHQLTISVRAYYFITLATSYFAFLLLILVALILVGLFVGSSLTFSGSKHELISTDEDAINATFEDTVASSNQQQQQQQQQQHNEIGGMNENSANNNNNNNKKASEAHPIDRLSPVSPLRRARSPQDRSRVVVLRQTSLSTESNASVCCSILLHLMASVGLIAILVYWLFNTGELVRENIASQLEYGLARYQFTNRSSRFSVAIDGMQDSNNCCGSLDYTDFPHGRVSGLPPGHYPGSCCGKNIFGVNARVLCMADEVWRAKQTSGCTTVLANHYDLFSLLIVPVALVCLFVNITIIALITISKGGSIGMNGGGRASELAPEGGGGGGGGGRNMREHRQLQSRLNRL